MLILLGLLALLAVLGGFRLVLFLRLLLLLFLQRVLNQLAVELRVLMTGLQLQRPVIRLERRLQLALLSQGITPVVLGERRIDRLQSLGGLVIFARLIFGRGFPAGINKSLGGSLGITRLQRPLCLLIGRLP